MNDWEKIYDALMVINDCVVAVRATRAGFNDRFVTIPRVIESLGKLFILVKDKLLLVHDVLQDANKLVEHDRGTISPTRVLDHAVGYVMYTNGFHKPAVDFIYAVLGKGKVVYNDRNIGIGKNIYGEVGLSILNEGYPLLIGDMLVDVARFLWELHVPIELHFGQNDPRVIEQMARYHRDKK